MDLSFLPQNILSSLKLVNLDNLYEIRMRTDFAVKVFVLDKYLYLSKDGCTLLKGNAIVCAKSDIDYVIKNVTEYSEYAHNNKIKCGYLTTKEGIRIGIAGECVFDGNNIVTIKNITSLNIRIPHNVSGCSSYFFNKIFKDNQLYSTLIMSNPFLGKTTLLKDLAIKLNEKNIGNLLLIDERGEFSSVKGENIDNICFCNKEYAFSYAVRSLAPKIIITDELSTKEDWKCVELTINSGLKIIASCHCPSIDYLANKTYFINGLFDRYVVLDDSYKMGQVKCVYDEEFNII